MLKIEEFNSRKNSIQGRIQFKEDKVKQNKRDFQQNNETFNSRDSNRDIHREIQRDIQIEIVKSRDSSRETRDIRTLTKFRYLFI